MRALASSMHSSCDRKPHRSVVFALGALLVSSLVTATPTASNATDPVVNLGFASYRGLLNDTVPDVVSWLGVRYAKPPRRFRAPILVDETPRAHNVTDATVYPPFCVQGWSPWAGPNDQGGAGSEDCLYVNIYAPKNATNKSDLPVLAYIHGGGYFAGNPRSWPFDNWVQRSPTPFVAVTIYYRLSALGFLAAPEEPGKGVYAGNDPELLLNAGIHDQRLALRFIQRHIRSFGGDPAKVTIMGQSAGGGSVGLHLAAQSANPSERLFRRAILQSWYRPPVPYPIARNVSWNAITERVGCSNSSWTVARTLECLRTVDHVKFIQAADDGARLNSGSTIWMWQPVVDKKLFSDHPARLLRALPDVDIIVGHTTADSASSGTPFADIARVVYPGLTSDDAQTLQALYTKAGVADENMTPFALGEAMFRCSTHFLANTYGSRAHTYRFDEPDPINPASAGHSSDNYILYEGARTGSNGTTEFHALTPAQRGLADEVLAHFTSFYATGSPNAANITALNWPAHTSGKRIVFRAEGGGTGATQGTPGGSYVEELDGGEIERCNIWNSAGMLGHTEM